MEKVGVMVLTSGCVVRWGIVNSGIVDWLIRK